MALNSAAYYFVKTGVKISPLILGGGQQHGMRSGTENVAYLVGSYKALQIVRQNVKNEVKRLNGLQQLFSHLESRASDRITINGPLG